MNVVKLATGSQSGVLRIYQPCTVAEAERKHSGNDDLLIEEDTGAPIVQLALGRFSRFLLF